jgi:hypothetical protein
VQLPTPTAIRITLDSPPKPPLGFGLRAFVACQVIRACAHLLVLTSLAATDNLANVVDMAAATGPETQEAITSTLYTDAVLIGIDVAATIFGLSLIIRRHPRMRRFWLIFLSLYCLMQVGEYTGTISFLFGFAWLVYWIVAKRPRELQLSSFWERT